MGLGDLVSIDIFCPVLNDVNFSLSTITSGILARAQPVATVRSAF